MKQDRANVLLLRCPGGGSRVGWCAYDLVFVFVSVELLYLWVWLSLCGPSAKRFWPGGIHFFIFSDTPARVLLCGLGDDCLCVLYIVCFVFTLEQFRCYSSCRVAHWLCPMLGSSYVRCFCLCTLDRVVNNIQIILVFFFGGGGGGICSGGQPSFSR